MPRQTVIQMKKMERSRGLVHRLHLHIPPADWTSCIALKPWDDAILVESMLAKEIDSREHSRLGYFPLEDLSLRAKFTVEHLFCFEGLLADRAIFANQRAITGQNSSRKDINSPARKCAGWTSGATNVCKRTAGEIGGLQDTLQEDEDPLSVHIGEVGEIGVAKDVVVCQRLAHIHGSIDFVVIQINIVVVCQQVQGVMHESPSIRFYDRCYTADDPVVPRIVIVSDLFDEGARTTLAMLVIVLAPSWTIEARFTFMAIESWLGHA